MKGNMMSQAPTATQLFGPNPWITNPAPGGSGPGGDFLYNPNYFATPETAAIVLTIVQLGCKLQPGDCKLVEANAILGDAPAGSGFKQNMPNQMIKMPDGSLHFAGLIAFEFQAWPSIETINADLAQELGMPFVFVMPPPMASPAPQPVPGNQLLIGPIGSVKQQADGTFWRHVKNKAGDV